MLHAGDYVSQLSIDLVPVGTRCMHPLPALPSPPSPPRPPFRTRVCQPALSPMIMQSSRAEEDKSVHIYIRFFNYRFLVPNTSGDDRGMNKYQPKASMYTCYRFVHFTALRSHVLVADRQEIYNSATYCSYFQPTTCCYLVLLVLPESFFTSIFFFLIFFCR